MSHVVGKAIIGLLVLGAIINGIIALKFFYDLQIGANAWIPESEPDPIGRLSTTLPLLILGIVFFAVGYYVIKMVKKVDSLKMQQHTNLTINRKDFLFGASFGGLFVLQLSQLFSHTYDFFLVLILAIGIVTYSVVEYRRIMNQTS